MPSSSDHKDVSDWDKAVTGMTQSRLLFCDACHRLVREFVMHLTALHYDGPLHYYVWYIITVRVTGLTGGATVWILFDCLIGRPRLLLRLNSQNIARTHPPIASRVMRRIVCS
jgi:hypothetical protein